MNKYEIGQALVTLGRNLQKLEDAERRVPTLKAEVRDSAREVEEIMQPPEQTTQDELNLTVPQIVEGLLWK